MTLNPDQATAENPSRIPEQTILDQGSPFPASEAVDASSLPPLPSVQNLSFYPPVSDPRYPKLTESAREELHRTLKALEYIHRATNVQRACRVQAAHFMHRRGFSADSLSRKYYFYKSTGNWLDLLNKAKAGPEFYESLSSLSSLKSLPPDFIEFFRKLCERNQRKCKPAHRELLRIWRTGFDSEGREYKSIPGYPSSSLPSLPSVQIPADPITGIPKGWSFENLNRHRPQTYELALTRVGRFAASEFTRKVFTTRVGLAVGQYIVFDDQDYDVKINFTASNGSCQRASIRPCGLNALDLFSACHFAFGLKPRVAEELASGRVTKRRISEEDMMWFVVHVLMDHGYRADGTHLVVERGTAAIRPEFEARITSVTGGKVIVDRSGVFGEAALLGLFEGQKKGNFRFKAPLESSFNLVRNEMAMIPGQTGKDWDHSPEQLYGAENYNNRLIKAADDLTPERAELLKKPFWGWAEFLAFAIEMYHRINTRTEHDLEGWEKSGLLSPEWRLDPSAPWRPQSEFLALPDAQREALLPYIQGNAALARVRKMSPAEAFALGRPQLAKLSYALLPDLLGPALGQLRVVRKGYITIADREIDTEEMHFPASDQSNPSNPVWFDEGKQFRCYMNPFNPSKLVLASPDGNRFVAILDRQQAVCRADLDGIKRQMSVARKEEFIRRDRVNQRHADRAQEKASMHRHNAAVLNGRPMTHEQHEAAQLIRNLATSADTALEEDCTADPSFKSLSSLKSFSEDTDY